MKYLECIRVVQFFLFEKQELRLGKITGIFGPNGSGKSSLLDAVQIAMLGANSRLVALNAQADEQTSTRSLRSYCLGQYGESPEHRARENATTYITLIWRDSETQEPVSMGVCVYAASSQEGHEVLGRYILRGVELSMGDHIEIVDGQERPREWLTFKHQLVERSRVSGEDPLFNDANRYIQAALLALRGSGNAPNTESFMRAFRFALRMRFDKTVDQIVRGDVLESRPTNIKKFREVTESFRRLAELVAHVETKIVDAERAESEFSNAARESRRAITWDAMGKMAAVSVSSEIYEQESERKSKFESELEVSRDEKKKLDQNVNEAKAESLRFRLLREAHAAHKDFGALQTEIQAAKERSQVKARDLRQNLLMIQRTLAEASKSPELQTTSTDLVAAAHAVETVIGKIDTLTRDELETKLRPALKAAEKAHSELFRHGASLERQRTVVKESLDLAKAALQRIKEGRAPLSDDVHKLLTELKDHGLNPTPVCDLVRISDASWQPVIEAYLGRHIEALLVTADEEKEAFRIYRSLTGHRAIYGAKLALESRQKIEKSPAPGSVAELIVGDHEAAVSYLRRQFGDIQRATTDIEALSGKRTLTQDGMLVSGDDLERLRPVPVSRFRVGAGSAERREELQNEVRKANEAIQHLEVSLEKLKGLLNNLRDIATEKIVTNYVLDTWTEMDRANRDVSSKDQQLKKIADKEYVLFGEQEREWCQKVDKFVMQGEEQSKEIVRLEFALDACSRKTVEAEEKLSLASLAAEAARNHPEYDTEFWAAQWDSLLDRFVSQYQQMVGYCIDRQAASGRQSVAAASRGLREFGTFLEKYREQASMEASADWIKARAWLSDLLQKLKNTELAGYKEDMNAAYRTSQETFRNDVAIALSNNLEWLDVTMDRLNAVLKSCPTFSNGERYRFRRNVRPQLDSLLKFVKDVAAFGPTQDLLGGAGEIPEAFRQLLEDKSASNGTSVRSPLDDYREFYEFEIEILREDPLTKVSKVVGQLSKRLGPGSGGEHRAPLYVIAGAALASAYRIDRGNKDGLSLMLLDEAFNKMDMTNIIATMRYLESLGLQVFMASPGENLGTLTAFLYRYYDLLRDADNNTLMIQGHDVEPDTRTMFREDLTEFNPALVEQELAAIRSRSATEMAAVGLERP